MAKVTLTVTIEDEGVAWQLAQFCKRSEVSTFYNYTETHLLPDERRSIAYQMIAGIEAVQDGLREAGFDPR